MGLIRKEDIHESLLNSLSNPNLFINGDFRNPVNQREKSEYTSNTYCIDRWRKWTDKFTTSVRDDFLRNQGTWIVLLQYLDDSPKLFKKGTVFTMSAKVKCEKTRPVKFSYYDHTSSQSIGELCPEITVGTDWQVISHTVTVNVDIVHRNTAFCIETSWSDTDTATLDIEWMKLELGPVATPFVPRLYAEERALCQRYYQVVPIPQTPYPADTNQFKLSIRIPCSMRIVPTLSWGSLAYMHSINGPDVKTLCSNVNTPEFTPVLESDYTHKHSTLDIGLEPTVEGGTLWTVNSSPNTSNRLSGNSFIHADAEIY